MQFGIALHPGGVLATPDAVLGIGRAAEALAYASIWSTSLAQLAQAAAGTTQIPLGLWLGGMSGSRAPELPQHDLDRLGEQLHWVAGPETWLHPLAIRGIGPLLLSSAPRPPAETYVDGWAPEFTAGLSAPVRPGRFVLRVDRTPTVAELRTAFALGADELLLGLSRSTTLDEQLAGFAAVAEQLAGQPDG
jgi:hypothetical protein